MLEIPVVLVYNQDGSNQRDFIDLNCDSDTCKGFEKD